MPTELAAQAVDLLAILAADKRTPGDPRRVPRPDYVKRQPGPAGAGRGGGRSQDDGFKQAIDVLRSTSRTSYVSDVPVASPSATRS